MDTGEKGHLLVPSAKGACGSKQELPPGLLEPSLCGHPLFHHDPSLPLLTFHGPLFEA